MALKVAVQMDPIESISIRGDSTFAMMLEAQARGHELFYYQTRTLALSGGKLYATGSNVSVRDEVGNHYTLGEERRADLGRYDVVLMDLQMPVMDGLTAVRRMRKWELVHNRRRTPIIAMTAYAFEEDRVRSLHAGCDATVSKPVRINTLISAIGEAL